MPCDFEYIIRYCDMPYTLKAFTVYSNNFYNIFVNSRISCEQQHSSIQHELKHIGSGDFDKDCNTDLLELIRHYASSY